METFLTDKQFDLFKSLISDFLISAENKMAPFFHFGTSLGIIGECVSELQVRPWVGKLGVVEVIQQVLDCAV